MIFAKVNVVSSASSIYSIWFSSSTAQSQIFHKFQIMEKAINIL